MLVAGALFATMGVMAKLLGNQFSGAELALYRSLIGLVAVGRLYYGGAKRWPHRSGKGTSGGDSPGRFR